MQISPDLLRALGARDADAWDAVLRPAMARHAINAARRLAAFLANTMHETGNYAVLVESLDYTPERLMAQWPLHFGPENAYRLGRTDQHPADQHMVAELAYGGRMGNGKPGTGDGYLYRGRGLIQITGRANYQRFADAIGVTLAELPALLQTREGAAESAASWWESGGVNAIADTGDIDAVRRKVNGGTIGVVPVRARYLQIMRMLGAAAEPAAPKPSVTAEPTADDLNARELAAIKGAQP